MDNLIKILLCSDFFLFVLGVVGTYFFIKLHKLLVKCDPTVFSYVCVILTYVVIMLCFA